MKITTQRTSLWLINFLVVGGMFVVVFFFAKRATDKAFQKERRQVGRDLGEMLDIRIDVSPESASGVEKELRTAFDPNFFYAGYVAPPKVEARETPTGLASAPKLETLLELDIIFAPMRSGPNDDQFEKSGVVVRIKKLPPNQNSFWYAEGQDIGVELDKRNDKEPTLAKFACRVIRCDPDGVVFLWDKQEVKVPLGARAEPEGITISGGVDNTSIGSLGAGAGASRAAVADADAGDIPTGKIATVVENGRIANVTVTADGFDQLNNSGEALLEGISVESTKAGNGRDALKVNSIPPALADFGIRDGDIVISIDNKPVTSKESIVQHVRSTYKSRRTYVVRVQRDGQMRTVKVNVPSDAGSANRLRRSLDGVRTR